MFKKTLGCLVVVGAVLAVIPSTCFALNRADIDAYCAARNATYSTSSQRCVCNSGYTESGGTCVSTGGSSGPSRDYEAERRAQEQAEAARRAEEERQAELEQQRRAEEERRRQEEAERQADFIRKRDEAADSLRGSTGIRITPNTPGGTALRGSTALRGEPSLKDALNDTGLRGTQPPKNAAKSEQTKAWQQLNCASYIAGFALGALQKMGDYQEFGTLSIEAMKALDGQRTSVECPAAPAMPDLKGQTVDMERVQSKQKQILDRASKIAERMKQTEGKKPDPKSTKPAPANETALEKTVRVQKELNEKNSEKVYGTQQEINQKEKDRKELTKLILENEKLTSVGFDVSEDAPAPKRRKHTKVPSPSQ